MKAMSMKKDVLKKKHVWRRAAGLLMAGALVIGVTGCGNGAPAESQTTDRKSVSGSTPDAASSDGASAFQVADSSLGDIEKLVTANVLENYEDGSFQQKDLEIDRIIMGSFSGEKAEELLVLCRVQHLPHAGGTQTMAAVVLDRATWQIKTMEVFRGDEVTIERMKKDDGQDRILVLKSAEYQGISTQTAQLFEISDTAWKEIRIEALDQEDYFCFIEGDSMIVTSTVISGSQFGFSGIQAVLKWDPRTGNFEKSNWKN